jgi:hypothetical protein
LLFFCGTDTDTPAEGKSKMVADTLKPLVMMDETERHTLITAFKTIMGNRDDITRLEDMV